MRARDGVRPLRRRPQARHDVLELWRHWRRPLLMGRKLLRVRRLGTQLAANVSQLWQIPKVAPARGCGVTAAESAQTKIADETYRRILAVCVGAPSVDLDEYAAKVALVVHRARLLSVRRLPERTP